MAESESKPQERHRVEKTWFDEKTGMWHSRVLEGTPDEVTTSQKIDALVRTTLDALEDIQDHLAEISDGQPPWWASVWVTGAGFVLGVILGYVLHRL